MNTPHPELETLAELAEQAESTSSPALADARAHVAGCPACSTEVAALRDVTKTLRSLPEIPMPDDVAARLESALRAEAGAVAGGANVSVLPGRAGSSGSSSGSSSHSGAASGRRMPHFSAAAAVTVLVVAALGTGLGLVITQGGGESKKSTSASGGLATNRTTVLTSGTDYSQSAIRGQVAQRVLTGVPEASSRYGGLEALAGADAAAQGSQPAVNTAPSAAPSTTASAAASASGTFAATTPIAPPPTSPGGPLASSEALKACIVALVQQPVTPILVDYALYQGKPATIIVLADPEIPNTLDVYVEYYTADCVTKGDVAFFGTLSTTAP